MMELIVAFAMNQEQGKTTVFNFEQSYNIQTYWQSS